jgi:pimeloyl-ACP methyl ester carboxylesterase
MRAALALLVLVLLALAAAPAGAAAQRVETIRGASGPGPAALDRVTVVEQGPRDADTVLVLVPGTASGAGDFTLVGRELVRRVPGLQVWSMDRRGNALEDTSRFEAALAGRISAREAFDYYLGWLADPSISPRFQPRDEAELGFAREWGLPLQIADLRRVIQRARRGGRRVVLGGHSLGASVTLAYAAWDFAGRPGHRDLDGMVLIDGGLLGSFTVPTFADVRRRLAAIRSGSPFLDLTGLGLPWAAGVFAETGSLLALKEPTAPSVLQGFPLLPEAFRPPVPVTNRGLLGFSFDATTAPEGLELIRVRAGRLASGGEPRDWRDGEVTPIANLARLFAQRPVNGLEWYYPARLNLDVDAANDLRRTRAARLLGLRLAHTRSVPDPLYALETDLTDGRVLRGARRFLARSDSPRSRAVLVDAAREQSHLDPLTAAPRRNRFLRTVVPFLRRLAR